MYPDTSPLATVQLYYRFNVIGDWLARWDAAVQHQPVYVDELVRLLRSGLEVQSGSVEDERRRYRIYFGIVAGMNAPRSPQTPESYHALTRETVEKAAFEVLRSKVLAFPFETRRLYEAAVERSRRQGYDSTNKIVLSHVYSRFLVVLMDREVLRLVFEVFDPAHTKTNLSWWKHRNKDDEDNPAKSFFAQILTAIWTHGHVWHRPELITWARRKTLPWVLRRRIAVAELRDAAQKELWMFSPMRFQLGLWRRHIPRLRGGYPRLTPKALADRRAKVRRPALKRRPNRRRITWRRRILEGKNRRPIKVSK